MPDFGTSELVALLLVGGAVGGIALLLPWTIAEFIKAVKKYL